VSPSSTASATSEASATHGASQSAPVTPTETTAPAWSATGSMIQARYGQTSTLLPDGRVLVVGGRGDGGDLASAELYDPITGSWTVTGSMLDARTYHSATLLLDGTVLVAGGALAGEPYVLASAEIYDLGTGSWTATGSMTGTRYGFTATVLPDGTVLVAGGESTQVASSPGMLSSAELYHPRTGSWTATGNLATARGGHTATLLQNGKVLVVGGISTIGDYVGITEEATAELYDPSTRTWAATTSMDQVRSGHTATLLPDGTVLVVGGQGSGGEFLVTAARYDPQSGSWTATGNMDEGRAAHTATLLANGSVLVAGGSQGPDVPSASAELYDPDRGSWIMIGSMAAGRAGHTATLLRDGEVLVAAGSGGGIPGITLESAELYHPGGLE
jgi:hypothetical protein